VVSVVIPDSSRSWIGKAHLIGSTVKATYISPFPRFEDEAAPINHNGTNTPKTESPRRQRDEEWVVIMDGTPASCVQLGIYNLFQERGPVDLVVSGPNHGRNASTIYNLSSGTVGGALEAATCGKRAIALSYASKDEQAKDTIDAASRLSVKLVEHLYNNWAKGVDIYNVNVPMRSDIELRPIFYASASENRWTEGSLYRELDPSSKDGNGSRDRSSRDRNGSRDYHSKPGLFSRLWDSPPERSRNGREKYFRWAPDLSDIHRGMELSQDGTDARTLQDGCVRYVLSS
jgi:5'/3'-nucleotidase SurE